ncbi:hypothetical protein [Streptomyces melanogenes]
MGIPEHSITAMDTALGAMVAGMRALPATASAAPARQPEPASRRQ